MVKYIAIIVVMLSLGACETNYGTINTGLANGKFDGSMYEYFQANHYDWDSLVLMIDRAGLKVFICGMIFRKGLFLRQGSGREERR